MFILKLITVAILAVAALYFLAPVVFAALTALFTKRPKVVVPSSETFGEKLVASVKRTCCR